MMYQAVKKHVPVLEKYAQSLIKEGTVSQEEYQVRVRVRGHGVPGGIPGEG